MKTGNKGGSGIKRRLLSLLLTAAMVFTMLLILPPVTVYAAEPTSVGTYAEFIAAVEDEASYIIVTSDFSLDGDVTIDYVATITSESDYTIDTNSHSLKIVNGGEVSLKGSLSLTGTSTTIQVLYGGELELSEYYTGTISTTGTGGKAIYAVGGTTKVHIFGGTVLAGPGAKSALSLDGHPTRIAIRGGTIRGEGNAYGIYMEDSYGTPLKIYISESGPDIDEVYYHWVPGDAPELAGDYPLLKGLPDPISMYVNEVMELDFDEYLDDEWEPNYAGDPGLNVHGEYDVDSATVSWTISPVTEGNYDLILKIEGTEVTIPVTVTTGFAGGDGTPEHPYQIENAEQLNRVRSFLGSAFKDTWFVLTAPIDLSSYSNWEPIGDIANPFCGYFSGMEYDYETGTYITHTISNLTINRPDESYLGLFGYCASAYIEGVAIRDANVTGGNDSCIGALVGETVGYIGSEANVTDIVYCSVTESVMAGTNSHIGGLAGWVNDTNIYQSYSTASVTGTLSYSSGGLVGWLRYSTISDSYAAGPVTSSGADNCTGGLVGFSEYSWIYNSYAAGKVTGEGATGGLIGESSSSNISQSYFNIANAASSDEYNSKGIGLKTYSMICYNDYFDYWNFETDGKWGIDPWESYPYLRDNEQLPHPAPPPATSARIVEETVEPRYNASTKTLTMTYASVGANLMAEDVTPGDGLVKWSSSDTNVAYVSWNYNENIVIENVGVGTATISLKSANGDTLDSITVVVEPMSLPITGSFTVQDKVYDGSVNAVIIDPASLSLDTSGYRHTDEVYADFAATFSDPDVGENMTVSLSTSTLGGEDAENYVIDFDSAPTTAAAITPKELTISGSFTAQGKAYDGTTGAAIAFGNLTLVGKVGSDDVTLVPVLAFDTPDIGTGKMVSLTADSYLTGAKAGNYTLSIVGAPTYASGVIADRALTLGGTFTAQDKVYDGTTGAAVAFENLTLVGIDPDDEVSIASVDARFDSAAAGVGKTVRIIDVALAGADAEKYVITLTGAPTATANITAKPLTITGSFTVEDRQYNGTINAAIDTNNLTLSGIIGSDIVSLNAGAVFDDANAGTDKTVSLTGSTLTGADAANYVIDFTGAPTTTADITRATGLQAPAAPTLQSKTSTSVTLTPNAEQEFSKDNGTTWQTSNVFTGLTPSTSYSFITRIRDGANHEASPASAALTVTTDSSSSSDGDSSGGGGSFGGGFADGSGSTPSAGGLEIPSSFISSPGSGKTLTLKNDFAAITIPSGMLDNIPGITGKKAEISIGQGDKSGLPNDVKAAIGDRPLISLNLLIDGKQTAWSNPDAPVTVSIPYTPTADELKNPDSIVVWYIDGSGNPQCITNGHYDPVTGAVIFDVTHFSDYAVVYNPVSFNDVKSGAWYYKAVSFIAARDITGGTGSGKFSPDVRLKRGDFLVMLMKAYDIAPDTNPVNNFSDAGNTYYTGYLAAARRLGITSGVGNNMYAPGKEITRQEMFTLLYNALKVIGQLPGGDSGRKLSDYSDAGQIDSWAKDAMTLLVKAGTVSGNAGKLSPKDTTTRAEMAQVLYNLLSK
jgi:uncharacterized membrane protein YgcG